jgi:[ribosomal protein S18]-alanine N-acetyltransferase
MDRSATQYYTGQTRVRPIDALHIGDLIRIADETNLSPWTAQGYLDEMKNDDAIMLRLVSDENRTLGFIVGRTVVGGAIEPRLDAEIYNIAIAERYQGNGFGQILFDAFAETCRERGVENIWLDVRESNHKAINFYARNDFARVQTRNYFYDNPREHAVLMRLILGK